MNPLKAEAVASIHNGWILGLMTVLFLVFFLGWTIYAYRPSHRAQMDAAARLPLSDDGSVP